MRAGDFILKIGDRSAENFTHADARSAIIEQGNYLELTLQRFLAASVLRRNKSFLFLENSTVYHFI
jgi:hypothetical protein